MFRLDEAAALLKPFDIDLRRKIILEEDRYDKDEAGHKGEAGEIVNVLGRLRNAGEGVGADDRQQQDLPEGNVDPSGRE